MFLNININYFFVNKPIKHTYQEQVVERPELILLPNFDKIKNQQFLQKVVMFYTLTMNIVFL